MVFYRTADYDYLIMPAGGVQVTGLNKLTRDLQTLGLELDDLKDAFGKIAAQGAGVASSFAPKRTGALQKSVRGNRAKNKAIVAAGRARVKYAGPVNYGWPKRGIKPALFMQRADQVMRPIALNQLEKSIELKIRQKGLQ